MDEELVKGSIKKLLDDSVSDNNMAREISRKLRDSALNGSAKENPWKPNMKIFVRTSPQLKK